MERDNEGRVIIVEEFGPEQVREEARQRDEEMVKMCKKAFSTGRYSGKDFVEFCEKNNLTYDNTRSGSGG